MGFTDAEVTVDEAHRRISFVISDRLLEENAAPFLSAIDHIVNLILKKQNLPLFVVDVNYYRKERERLISELARAAAKKAVISKVDVELPPMNSYERRLVHVEIMTHPELKTESAGVGKERHVIIKHV
jgi:spoIIIJ-associated protein